MRGKLQRGRPWLTMALCLALCSCAMGPDYHAPAPPPGATGQLPFMPGGAAPTPVPEAWWKLYQDPALNQLVERAFLANTDLRAAQANLDTARASLRIARSARLPTTMENAGATYGRTPTQTEIADALHATAPNGWLDTDTFQVAYEVDLFGRIKRSVEAARADADAAQAQRDAVRLMVASETIRAYVSACAIGAQIDVARQLIDLSDQQRAIVQKQLDAGGATRFDVARSTTLLAQARASLPVLDGERRAALFALAAMLGATPDAVPMQAQACRHAPELAQAVPVGDGAALLRRRPDIRVAERRLAAASARIGVAQADLLPRISLLGSVSNASPDVADLGTRAATSFGLGPFVSWSFPNLGAARGRIAAARATDRAALADFDGAIVVALKEVEQSLARYGAALDRTRELDAASTSAREAYALAQSRFAAGSISRFEMLSAQQSLVETQAALAAAQTQRTDLLVSVFKALGGGWQTDPPQAR